MRMANRVRGRAESNRNESRLASSVSANCTAVASDMPLCWKQDRSLSLNPHSARVHYSWPQCRQRAVTFGVVQSLLIRRARDRFGPGNQVNDQPNDGGSRNPSQNCYQGRIRRLAAFRVAHNPDGYPEPDDEKNYPDYANSAPMSAAIPAAALSLISGVALVVAAASSGDAFCARRVAAVKRSGRPEMSRFIGR